jgi:glycosyltransferase involved in cell wall biosynthesis
MSQNIPQSDCDSSVSGRRESHESLSIIVCTRNRTTKLARCLEALLAMKVEGVRWEVICVDNASTDATKETIETFAKNSHVPIRYVYERAARLSLARNAGLSHSSGDILVFTDDDCIVDPTWLATISKEFRADPSLAMLGGRVELNDKCDLPLAVRPYKQRAAIQPTNFFSFIGAGNMAFRRRVIDRIGMFDPRFGPGSSLLAAEDSDFAYRTLKAGFKAVYSPDVLVLHDHGRQTGQDRTNMEEAYVTGRGAFYLKHALRGDRQVMRLALWESLQLVKGAWRSLIDRGNGGEDARLFGHLLTGACRYVRFRPGSFAADADPN